ncbi:MAG: DNA repair protein RadA, partial [Gemmatimonadales bacterium]
MAKPRSSWRCAECGHDHARWVGRCEGCGEWNTVAEEPLAVAAKRGSRGAAAPAGSIIRLRDVV